MEPERLWRKRVAKEISFKSGPKSKAEGVIDGDSEGGDFDEVMHTG